MRRLDVSISYQRIPWAAEVGKAWWLLCHASPKDSSEATRGCATRRRFEAPAPEEVAQRVDREGHVVQDEQPHRAAPQQAGERGGKVPPISQPSPKAAPRPPIAQ